jgi:hypothetical protein
VPVRHHKLNTGCTDLFSEIFDLYQLGVPTGNLLQAKTTAITVLELVLELDHKHTACETNDIGGSKVKTKQQKTLVCRVTMVRPRDCGGKRITDCQTNSTQWCYNRSVQFTH